MDWIFNCDPKKFDLRDAAVRRVRDWWAANQRRDDIRVGDKVWFRLGGPAAGLYLTALVTRAAYYDPNEYGGWKCDVEFTNVIDPPLKRGEIACNDALSNFRPLMGAQGTNFPVPDEIAEAIEKATGGRLRPVS